MTSAKHAGRVVAALLLAQMIMSPIVNFALLIVVPFGSCSSRPTAPIESSLATDGALPPSPPLHPTTDA